MRQYNGWSKQKNLTLASTSWTLAINTPAMQPYSLSSPNVRYNRSTVQTDLLENHSLTYLSHLQVLVVSSHTFLLFHVKGKTSQFSLINLTFQPFYSIDVQCLMIHATHELISNQCGLTHATSSTFTQLPGTFRKWVPTWRRQWRHWWLDHRTIS